MFAGKKSAQIREILISESTWEEMTCLFAPSLVEATLIGLFGSKSNCVNKAVMVKARIPNDNGETFRIIQQLIEELN
ncbi:hypothetical protein O5831_15965 [Escherichia coli]|nr:hypothetical protein [Escherichia coli]MCZ5472252.1 hypothetical protein [Escherichia coli]